MTSRQISHSHKPPVSESDKPQSTGGCPSGHSGTKPARGESTHATADANSKFSGLRAPRFEPADLIGVAKTIRRKQDGQPGAA
jgi:hypothetical protein